ncbi:MAG TPA: S-layer homology domain-containing protein [Acidimicrobiales bacterium]
MTAVLGLVLVALAASVIPTSGSLAGPVGLTAADGFSDVPASHQFYDEITWLAQTGITTGYPDGTFRPSAPITRQAMAAFFYRLEGEPAAPGGGWPDPGFSDVPASHQFYEEIAWLAQTGITTGYPDGTFRPGAAITRQAMAAFFYRLVAPEKSPPYGITEASETFDPRGVAWNGVKVYLSSPRHASSGSRGECGWEENVNGHIFNLYAADLNEGAETLTTRGYQARVSPNTRDNGWLLNRNESDNWGANVHIATHTNAFGAGCGDPVQHLLVMYRSNNADSMGLRQALLDQLDPHVPGDQSTRNCDTLGECGALAPHVAYLELFFHTNEEATDWFTGPAHDPRPTGAVQASPFVGAALDQHLGSPRAAEAAASVLDAYAGFGISADAELRDETIAYAEAFEREEVVRECMAEAGFEYAPAVAFPAGDVAEIADSLGVDPAEDASGGSPADSSPSDRNRAYERALPADEQERYNQTLLGESAEDVAEADRTGVVPDGRPEDFATGGCVGEARDAVPSVWDARRALDDELAAMVGEIESADHEPASTAAAERFVDGHAAQLAAVAQRYDGAIDEIAHDPALLDQLAAHAAEAG